MKSINLIFGLLFHQPVGISEEILQQAYQNTYKPFLSILNSYPEFHVVLHFSGIVLEWLYKTHPEYISLLKDMVKRNQVEFIGGGYYDPILPLIPVTDRIGQIEKLTTYIRSITSKKPRGCWITGQFWESSLTTILKTCGMEYAFLDDDAFKLAHADKDDLFYPHLTEDQGNTITVFPIMQSLGYHILNQKPEKIVSFLGKISNGKGQRVVILFNDISRLLKLTENNNHNKNWLKRFFSLIIKNNNITTLTPTKYLKQYRTRNKIYFHNCMNNKSILKSTVKIPAIFNKNKSRQCCSFKEFLTRYHESNIMYAKMLYTHILVNQIRGDKYKKQAAKDDLWKGQNNSAYWPKDGGGIYKNHLRNEIYRNLISAEKETRIKGIFIPSINHLDFDMDGDKEFLYQGNRINAYVHIRGGLLFELDYIPSLWNYLDTLCRRPEYYHKKYRIPPHYDNYYRGAFIDHFFQDNTDIQSFANSLYKEAGDFMNNKYILLDINRKKKLLILKRNGNIKMGRKYLPFCITKRFVFKQSTIDVYYKLKNISKQRINTNFGIEINLTNTSKDDGDLKIFNSSGKNDINIGTDINTSKNTADIAIHDLINKNKITIQADKEFSLWSFPVETYCLCGIVIEKQYQSSCFLPHWQLSLAPEECWEIKISLSIKRL